MDGFVSDYWLLILVAVVVLTSLVIMYYLYYLRVPAAGRRWPWVSATIIAVTAVITGL